MLSPIIKRQVEAQVSDLVQLAQQRLRRAITLPTVGFRRSGRTAGSAHLQKNHINFNPVLLSEYPDNYKSDVVPHEVAHIVVYQVYGRVKPHGAEWQAVMRDIFNCEPATTHSMCSDNLNSKTFPYHCKCGPVQLTIRRHNKVMRGQQQYQCRTCGQMLKPTPPADS